MLEALQMRANRGGEVAEALVERAGNGVGPSARTARVGGVAPGAGGIAGQGGNPGDVRAPG